jgi:hypothetical protein
VGSDCTNLDAQFFVLVAPLEVLVERLVAGQWLLRLHERSQRRCRTRVLA